MTERTRQHHTEQRSWFPRTKQEISAVAKFIGYLELALAACLFVWALGELLFSGWLFWKGHNGPAVGNLWYALVAIITLVAESYYLRSRIRQYPVKRGLCLGCGYDLRASVDRCPECGRRIEPNPNRRVCRVDYTRRGPQMGGDRSREHDTIYSILLAAFAFLTVIAIVSIWWISRLPKLDPKSVWSLRLVVLVEVCLGLFEIAVLIVRLRFPAQRRAPTMVLNIIMLFWFPLGTALGIYGLWKVDRPARALDAQLQLG